MGATEYRSKYLPNRAEKRIARFMEAMAIKLIVQSAAVCCKHIRNIQPNRK